jgi:integrase
MALIRRNYKDRTTGKTVQSDKYYIDTAYQHRKIRFAAFTSKKASQALFQKIQDYISFKVAGQQPPAEIQGFIDELPENVSKHLVKAGLIDRTRRAAAKSLSDHIADYQSFMTSQGKSKSHISGTVNRIIRMFDFCGFVYIADINTAGISRFIRELAASNTTKNHYLTAGKMFFNYLMEAGQVTANPLKSFKKLPENRERKGILTSEQFITLIHHTEQHGDLIRKITGKERSMLYTLAGTTGLRRSEILSLRWRDFENTAVFIDGGRTKNGKDAHQPLPQDVAEAFTAWKVSKHGKDADRVFDTLTTNHRPSEMIRKDLEAAGLPTEDRAGNEICFHSLRNTYITLLANGSTPAKVIQQLARHSSLDLTMNIYARAEIHSQQAAINSLPKIKQPEKLKKSSG